MVLFYYNIIIRWDPLLFLKELQWPQREIVFLHWTNTQYKYNIHVKKLIFLVYANKTLYYILLENFGGIKGAFAPPSPPPPPSLHPCFCVRERLFSNVFAFLQIRKIEILSLISLTSSTTLVTINEL